MEIRCPLSTLPLTNEPLWLTPQSGAISGGF